MNKNRQNCYFHKAYTGIGGKCTYRVFPENKGIGLVVPKTTGLPPLS
jgi:hypothetical protein